MSKTRSPNMFINRPRNPVRHSLSEVIGQNTLNMLIKGFLHRDAMEKEKRLKAWEEQKKASAGPHTIQWKPNVRNWSYQILGKPHLSNWVQYPNACIMTINPAASIEANKVTLDFDIIWQPPAEAKTDYTAEWKHQHVHPFQDSFSFACEATSADAQLKTFSPNVPNKEVRFKSESSVHVAPEIELAVGPKHAALKLGLGHYSRTHSSAQSTKAIEVSQSSMCRNGFQVFSKLRYCNLTHTESESYDISDPSDSMQRTKGLIFGWDYLLNPPDIAKSAYKMHIKAEFVFPTNYQFSSLKFNITLGHRTTSMEVWKRVRGHRFTSHGLFKRQLEIVVDQASRKATCHITEVKETDKVSVVHTIHRSRAQTNLFCCTNVTSDSNKLIKDPNKADEGYRL